MREILGNKKGIRDSVLNELIALYDVQVPLGQLISAELALKLADICGGCRYKRNFCS